MYAGVSVRDMWHNPVDEEYQEFLDELPITRFSLDVGQRVFFGPERTQKVPSLMDRFDWRVDHFPFGGWPMRPEVKNFVRSLGKTPDVRRQEDPFTVYCAPHALQSLILEASHLDPHRASSRTLVIAGTDFHLSDALGANAKERNATLSALRQRFGRILAEAKDFDCEGVETMPMGLPENYLRNVDVPSVKGAVAAASLNKSRSVVAAWGKWMKICESSTLARHDLVACTSRSNARQWAQSEAAKAVGVEVRSIQPQDWWREISTYRFLMAPLGAGVQSCKVIEALMVLTIPIVERRPYPVHGDLVRMGFPIVVVDDWSEVSIPGRLEQWWEELSPRLQHFREVCLSADGYWNYAAGLPNGCGKP
eukprot:CAMPEP_0206421912 /NCGR_PEP_ID=MMETSP0324_2-20121206/1735_1 /ASSEMBLY_ACC=CAM_ASM_000836 /TAXON_ID=2866 /ORGANISM="Crypthecodinium cohnii, Strain Seligo" /LENGTH=364 /DNA_ID=CAMNT_0053886107 /DNA_START=132 /DNA_END=1226 /DNA_ORIENTATION=+